MSTMKKSKQSNKYECDVCKKKVGQVYYVLGSKIRQCIKCFYGKN